MVAGAAQLGSYPLSEEFWFRARYSSPTPRSANQYRGEPGSTPPVALKEASKPRTIRADPKVAPGEVLLDNVSRYAKLGPVSMLRLRAWAGAQRQLGDAFPRAVFGERARKLCKFAPHVAVLGDREALSEEAIRDFAAALRGDVLWEVISAVAATSRQLNEGSVESGVPSPRAPVYCHVASNGEFAGPLPQTSFESPSAVCPAPIAWDSRKPAGVRHTLDAHISASLQRPTQSCAGRSFPARTKSTRCALPNALRATSAGRPLSTTELLCLRPAVTS